MQHGLQQTVLDEGRTSEWRKCLHSRIIYQIDVLQEVLVTNTTVTLTGEKSFIASTSRSLSSNHIPNVHILHKS